MKKGYHLICAVNTVDIEEPSNVDVQSFQTRERLIEKIEDMTRNPLRYKEINNCVIVDGHLFNKSDYGVIERVMENSVGKRSYLFPTK